METKVIPDRSKAETTEVGEIARFYGFKPITAPSLSKLDFDGVKNMDQLHYPAEKAALMRMYFEEKMYATPQPSMFFCERPFSGSGDKKKPNRLECSLVSMGSTKSVCECLSMQAGIAILHKMGCKNLEVQINSIGDKDSPALARVLVASSAARVPDATRALARCTRIRASSSSTTSGFVT